MWDSYEYCDGKSFVTNQLIYNSIYRRMWASRNVPFLHKSNKQPSLSNVISVESRCQRYKNDNNNIDDNDINNAIDNDSISHKTPAYSEYQSSSYGVSLLYNVLVHLKRSSSKAMNSPRDVASDLVYGMVRNLVKDKSTYFSRWRNDDIGDDRL